MEPLLFFVDRISEGRAILLCLNDDENALDLPLRNLPLGTREGDYLSTAFVNQEHLREAAQKEISDIMDGLGDNP